MSLRRPVRRHAVECRGEPSLRTPDRHRRDPNAGVAVDTHVRRVSQRLGFTSNSDPDKIEQDLMKLIPRKDRFPFTYVLIEHGRQVCKAPTPRCEVCTVNDLCPSSRVR